MTEQILSVTTRIEADRVAVLCAVGEIDHDSRLVLSDAADEAIAAGRHRLIIDLAGVTFCDSGGLSLFVDLRKKVTALGGQLRLAAARPVVVAVVRATNLDRLLVLDATVQEAVAASLAGD